MLLVQGKNKRRTIRRRAGHERYRVSPQCLDRSCFGSTTAVLHCTYRIAPLSHLDTAVHVDRYHVRRVHVDVIPAHVTNRLLTVHGLDSVDDGAAVVLHLASEDCAV